MRIAYLGVLCRIPLVSILIFLSKRTPSDWIDVTLLALAVAALVLNFVAFFIWFSGFYLSKGLAIRKLDYQPTDTPDER